LSTISHNSIFPSQPGKADWDRDGVSVEDGNKIQDVLWKHISFMLVTSSWTENTHEKIISGADVLLRWFSSFSAMLPLVIVLGTLDSSAPRL
jgi:hypothetical protein